MLQNVSRKFRSGCMMLCRQQGEALSFLGTSFLVHREGYLLTAAHLAADANHLVVVPYTFSDDFSPMTFERVAGIPVNVAQRDPDNDVALLHIEQEMGIEVPDDFLGATEAVSPGASVMSLGFAFGHQQVHSLMGFNAVVSAKIRARNNTAMLLYDTAFHPGDSGGPLIHVADGHIVGIIGGRFEPAQAQLGGTGEPTEAQASNLSYAIAIEYGHELMEQQGLGPGELFAG